MLRKTLSIASISLLVIVFLASAGLAEKSPRTDVFFKKQAQIQKNTKMKLAGAEKAVGYVSGGGDQSLGYEAIISNSPGLEIGTSTYDLQSNCRNNRQIDWRGTQMIHMVWMKQGDSTLGSDRGTTYNNWDTDDAVLGYPGGGCDLHPRLGQGNNYSGYVGLDVDTEGKVVVGNHHDEGAGWVTTVWYDFAPGACFFSPYKRRLPDSVSMYHVSVADSLNDDWRFIWPSTEYQVFDGDTVTHAFSQQWENKDPESSLIHYFRRVGSDTLGEWDYPPMPVDTVQSIAQIVTASRISGKVALVWQAPPGLYPGDVESLARDDIDPGLGWSQRTNDIFYMISDNMGASWGGKNNLTGYDSTVGGWLGHGDMSCLIDTADYLHILYSMREILPTSENPDGGLGEYTHFYGARLFHWDEFNNAPRTVADANWDLPDSGCTGGAWNEMSIVKPILSYCDGKFYAFFTQFNDIYHGIDNDCAEGRFDGTYGWSGTANGEIYMSVSDDGGFSWDIARNLTDTYTPHCFPNEDDGLPVCESDHYPSVSRFGQQLGSADFSGAVVVDMGETPYAGDMFLDLQYLNDKFPGSCMQDDGVWTTNPIKWFRVACVDPIPNPVLVYSPHVIGGQNNFAWTVPGVPLVETLLMENIGNADLHISAITTITTEYPGWLTVGNSGPITLGYASGSSIEVDINLNAGGTITDQPRVVNGYIVIESDAVGGSTDSIEVELVVADTMFFPVEMDIRTACKRIMFSNLGNIGSSGENTYNLDYVAFDIDCDTTNNATGYDDHAGVYLYDASPFLSRINGSGDTLLSSAMFDISWLDENAFRPQAGPIADSITFADYQYGYSGKFTTQDSLLAVEVEYFAPTDPDTCSFIVMKQRIYNNTDITIEGVIMGDLMDWDIPSDSGSRNQSGYNDAPNKQLMYTVGYDYGLVDTLPNNDCIDDDVRVGGFSYYAGYKRPYAEGAYGVDSFPELVAQWTHMNADWVYPEGEFVPEQIYAKAVGASGYETWEATDDQTNSDSVAQDLHHVAVFGTFDIAVGDTFIFVKIITTEYDGGVSALEATVEKARAWITGHPEVFAWPTEYDDVDCCTEETAGDSNCNGSVNILDITYCIAYLYKGGPEPCCMNSADANKSCTVNILDITFLIAYLYKGGPPPECGCVLPL